ncbi:hypothetical protein SAMN05443636_1879 [Halobaculum gomorrense]|uniref:Uncharacterized protein n=1 Tax=Halobaculum gomorrense TaxID=43928 RepID=A0A1M5QF05_9EURY|nr:hypothetical protein SAMN05443636_1879 [Halobaculum gomorrense]
MPVSERCHITEWAALLEESVPETACDERRLEFRPREER